MNQSKISEILEALRNQLDEEMDSLDIPGNMKRGLIREWMCKIGSSELSSGRLKSLENWLDDPEKHMYDIK